MATPDELIRNNILLAIALIVGAYVGGKAQGKDEGYRSRISEVKVLCKHIIDLYDQFEIPKESRQIENDDLRLYEI